jgi:hypothetical protein
MCHGGKNIGAFGGYLRVTGRRNYTNLILNISNRNIAFGCTVLLQETEKEVIEVLGSL